MRNEVIKVGAEVGWLAPVWVRVGNGSPEIIRGPKDALLQLQFRWPAVHGECYRSAQSKCLAALSRRIPAEEAREEFILASIEANMLD